MKTKFDSLDIKILNVLKDDATLGYTEVSRKVKSPPTTVFQRVKRLKERQIIKKIVPIIDHELLDYSLTAFIKLSITDIKEMDRIAKELSKLDEVLDIHHVTGDNEIMLKIKTRDNTELKDFEIEKIGSIKGIKSLETMISIGTYKEDPNIKLKL
ncbi:MAG: Lrp/AsnC family transcriptional regulator [Candidatus Thermoplasmatota archaeon]|jgi:Lrp/AsnC family transcriptional regulator for asnA, asnC and gidA|nr:Lrp/AsnC family transcriptional regulator [Candidatus Thermoplasmatota archaeon]